LYNTRNMCLLFLASQGQLQQIILSGMADNLKH
jgi:hypothetical protein